jgi:LemA protein
MMAVLIILLVLIGLAVVVLLYGIGVYNGLVGKRNRMKTAWSQVDVQLTQRHDNIPNLVECVKGYMAHEKDTLDAVVSARAKAVNAQGPEAAIAAEMGLTGAMGKLFAVMENYPTLKADSSVQNLMETLNSIENKISFARQHYNDMVNTYNIGREVFPANIIAGAFNFEPGTLFEITDDAVREVPKVQF